MDPQQRAIAEEFDGYATRYNCAVSAALSFSGIKVDAFVRAKAEHILRTIDGHFPRRSELSVLDLGCGVGNYHDFFSGLFARLAGADVSSNCIAQARQLRPDVEYHAYDGETLPFPDRSFDAVYVVCVLHHVPVALWTRFVREMHRVLKRGGLALVYEHNPRNLFTMKAVHSCPFDADATLLRPAECRALLGKAGFGRITARSIITVPPVQTPILKPLFGTLDRLAARLPFGTQYCARGERTT